MKMMLRYISNRNKNLKMTLILLMATISIIRNNNQVGSLSGIQIMHWNAQSLNSNGDELKHYLDELKNYNKETTRHNLYPRNLVNKRQRFLLNWIPICKERQKSHS